MRLARLASGFLRKAREQRELPIDARQSDVYVVEFPKSGITWLATILANAALVESGRLETACFANSRFYVPDIHLSRSIGDLPYDRPPVRFIKSHAEWNSQYVNVIYLVRHPADVMRSYYDFLYLQEKIRKELDFDSFLGKSRFGLAAWKRHVNSWLTGPGVASQIFLIRYEDLVANAEKEIKDLSRFFGWEFSDATIKTALSRSSIENMREMEAFYCQRNPRHVGGFVGGDRRVSLDEELRAYVAKSCDPELKFLGYVVE